MPSGRVHDRLTWALTPVAGATTWHYTASMPETLALAGAFLFAGLMFSGDLDLHSVQYRRWGPLRWIWKPYQWLVPHRSPFSHDILLGPAARLAYLTLIVAGAGLLALVAAHAYGAAPAPERVVQAGVRTVHLGPADWRLVAFSAGGLWLGGASHTLADGLGTTLGRLARPFGRRGSRRSRR